MVWIYSTVHITHTNLLCSSLVWFRIESIAFMLKKIEKKIKKQLHILNHIPRHWSSDFVLSPVLPTPFPPKFWIVPNLDEFSSAVSLCSPHPLVKAVLYSTSSISIFLLHTFCIMYFPFKLRTFIFLSFYLAYLHLLQHYLLSSSLLHLHNWAMFLFVFTLLFQQLQDLPVMDAS